MTASTKPSGLPVLGPAPSLDGATAWLGSPPLTMAGLKGKVVLVDFWTYSCINCLRELPYVRAWAEKYKDHGLVVIGDSRAGICIRARRRQREEGGRQAEARFSGCDRQRLCNLACLRQRVLAGGVFR
jgi:thiol-disulfide isomerase/thioredoxin